MESGSLKRPDSLVVNVDPELGVSHSCWLGPEPEDVAIKNGLLAISEALGSEGLLDFPRRKTGTPLLMRQGFFERLLKSGALLQDCAVSDVCAAEADVKRLSLVQLLAIRCRHRDSSAAGSARSKISFLANVDKYAMSLLEQRLFSEEELSDADTTLAMRHVVLMYSAHRLINGDPGMPSCDWWLFALRGRNLFLHIPTVKLTAAPEGCVLCCRSHSGPDPRDPRRFRVWRWLALLVQESADWEVEDLVPVDTKPRKSRARAVPVVPEKTVVASTDPEEPFGEFDVECLLDEFEDATRQDTTPTSVGPLSDGFSSPGLPKDDDSDGAFDDFFDELLSDAFGSPVPVGDSCPPAEDAVEDHDEETAVLDPPQCPSSPEVTDQGTVEHVPDTPVQSAPEPPPSNETGPPRDLAEARLRVELQLFYVQHKETGKLANIPKITRKYCGDGLPDLWAQLASKYSMPPSLAVQWLAKSMPPLVLSQWPAGSIPEAARRAVERVNAGCPAVSDSEEVPLDLGVGARITSVLEAAVEALDVDAVQALGFTGCPDPALRPRLWRTLLGVGGSDEQMVARRTDYVQLSASLEDAMAETLTDGEGDVGRIRAALEADPRSAWADDAFLTRTDVSAAIVNIITRWCAMRNSRYIVGSNDIAALILWVMAGCGATLGEAEADSFWCFTVVMGDYEYVGHSAEQVRRIASLLVAYDRPVADLLSSHGLKDLPPSRLSAALFTRAGFSIEGCAQLWDSLLSDHRRFEFSDHVVVTLLMLNRGNLLGQESQAGVAETLIAAPGRADVPALVRSACAVCAFERRLLDSSAMCYPPRQSASRGRMSMASFDKFATLAPALEAASKHFSHASRAATAQISEASEAASSLWAKAPQFWGSIRHSATSAAKSASAAASAALEAVKAQEAEAQAPSRRQTDEANRLRSLDQSAVAAPTA